MITSLEQDHQQFEKNWLQFESILKNSDLNQLSLLEVEIKEFQQQYEAYIQIENTQLIPEAALLLSSKQLAELGKKMRARRAVN